MFERFTDRARRVVVLAQEEARMLGHDYVGTEHLLLGLLHEGSGVAARALLELGLSLAGLRQEIELAAGRSESAPPGHIAFTPQAKRVLELSLREAIQLGHNYIGTEHLLLGLLREGDGVAARVLVQLGADLNRVRQQVIQLLASHPGRPPAEDAPAALGLRRTLPSVLHRLDAIEARLDALDAHPDGEPDRAGLAEVERLRSLLRQHGIDPEAGAG
jgi:ATP-dependent Clp protease ATP-binding subunit ClpC